MKIPKILYRYFNMKVEKFKVPSECLLSLEMPIGSQYPDGTYQKFGDLYRCKTNDQDFHGFASMQEAKAEHISVVLSEIWERQSWLKKQGFSG